MTHRNNKKSRQKPLIGVTMDLNIFPEHPTEAEYRVRSNYVDALTKMGAESIILPCEISGLPTYAEICDGVLITGSHPGNIGEQRRRAFEFALIETAMEKNIPLLGVCNGMQMLGVALGGDLIKSTSTASRTSIDHKPTDLPTTGAHNVILDPQYRLGKLINEKTVRVNSFHLDVLCAGGRFEIAARSPDGVIEAIVVPDRQYCVGVQWHPEYLLTIFDGLLFEDFVSECSISKKRRELSLA